MSQAPLILSTDAKEVLSILLAVYVVAMCALALWWSWPSTPRAERPQEPRPSPLASDGGRQGESRRLTVLRGPDHG